MLYQGIIYYRPAVVLHHSTGVVFGVILVSLEVQISSRDIKYYLWPSSSGLMYNMKQSIVRWSRFYRSYLE